MIFDRDKKHKKISLKSLFVLDRQMCTQRASILSLESLWLIPFKAYVF